MDFSEVARQLNFSWPNLVFVALRVALIAIAFEFIAWWVSRRLEKVAAPFVGLDQSRDAKWRAQRRATLKTTPRFVARALIYTIALILVFDVFGVPVLSLSIAVAAIAALLGLAFIPLLRDYSQGWVLLSEDTLAPGDVVEINGHQGQVEKWTLRATWIRDAQNRLHVLSNRDVRDVVIVRKAVGAPETPTAKNVAFDPLKNK